MKRSFFIFCAALFILGSLMPLAGYRLGKRLTQPVTSPDESFSGQNAPAEQGAVVPEAYTEDADFFAVLDLSTGEVVQVEKKAYILGAVAAEMPVDWPDEALKAQAVAAHSYALYCRDHPSAGSESWLSADPVRRQGYLTDTVLRSYWGINYERNFARLSALIEPLLDEVLCFDGSAACTSYFSLSNGMTEASENVWGSALPYLTAVESTSDRTAPNYEVTLTLPASQIRSSLLPLGLSPDASSPDSWFGAPVQTVSGYVAAIPVCGQNISGPSLRKALGLRSADFTIRYADGSFSITTHGYGHGVGLSQWGARALAEQGETYAAILAHYFPGTTLCN